MKTHNTLIIALIVAAVVGCQPPDEDITGQIYTTARNGQPVKQAGLTVYLIKEADALRLVEDAKAKRLADMKQAKAQLDSVRDELQKNRNPALGDKELELVQFLKESPSSVDLLKPAEFKAKGTSDADGRFSMKGPIKGHHLLIPTGREVYWLAPATKGSQVFNDQSISVISVSL